MDVRQHAALALALALLIPVRAARAAGALEIIGAPTSPNGLNARALGRGPEAAFFNPSLLPDAAQTTQAGLFVLVTHGDILLEARPRTADVPEGVLTAQLRNADGSTSRLTLRPLPTSKVPEARADTEDRDTIAYATLGVVRPLYEDYLVLGFHAMLPIRSFQEQKAFFADEREQYFHNRLGFELLGDRLSLTTFAVAMGSRVASWLSIGAGVDINIGTVARTAVHVPDAGDQRYVLINPDIEVESTFSPYFAVATRPSRMLRLTATLHMPSSSETDGENEIRFWNYVYPEGENSIRQQYKLSLGYEPLRFGVGAALLGPPAAREVREAPQRALPSPAVAPPAWELGARAVVTQWSEYRDRHAERPVDPWRNTVSAGVGGALVLGNRRVAADLAYTPSPVPDQRGRSNYVDNSRVGANLSFETPVSLFGADFGVSAFLHGQLFLAREVQKRMDARDPVVDELPDNAVDIATGDPVEGAAGLQTNNPGYPGWRSEGWMVGAGFALRLPE
ncbi:MAG: hypothetical protein IT372_01095 [Polyangiaceae bacterium]|nr:hypothetical protein [Polyangiaceae bacterium]